MIIIIITIGITIERKLIMIKVEHFIYWNLDQKEIKGGKRETEKHERGGRREKGRRKGRKRGEKEMGMRYEEVRKTERRERRERREREKARRESE